MNSYMDTPITSLKGIGEKSAKLFAKLNILTYGDLIFYYPRDYEEYPQICPISELRMGTKTAVYAVVASGVTVRRVRNLSILGFQIKDLSGMLQATIFNMPYLKNALVPGKKFVFYGKVSETKGRRTMEQPQLYSPEDYQVLQSTLQPRYALTKGITHKMVQKYVKAVLDTGRIQSALKEDESRAVIADLLPETLRQRYALTDYEAAIREIHFPTSRDACVVARRRLVFQEFLSFFIQTRQSKLSESRPVNEYPMLEVAETARLLEGLPYQLTGAQQKVWEQICEDLQGPYTMNRLIQGDVGSGKTIVAILALLMTAVNGFQGAFMAPTEVLARQHFDTVTALTRKYHLPFRTVLLSGSLTAKEKREAQSAVSSGEVNLVIGTQALIQDKVQFRKLALVITDEQHRFGVHQREQLAGKGNHPHICVMSATPIPRTLAIILFGDLSISIIDEYPKNRIPIKNCVIDSEKRNDAYHFIQKQIEEGHQAYVICPMVEDGIMEDLENVVDYTERLRAFFPEAVQIAYLHGKMKSIEKNKIMDSFAGGHIDILVSTTVIEVGIDVPNATVIMIENAERFGLAGLHQLRGRVGRGAGQSYCIFVSESRDAHTKERLDILVKSNDGFYIAGEDMRLRGPGDVFGIRQSGVLEFRLGDIYQDSDLLKQASECSDLMLSNREEYSDFLADLSESHYGMVDFRTI